MSETVRSELSAAAEAIGRYRSRVTSLVEIVGDDSEELTSAMYEAERALITAERLLMRAEKLARR